MSTAEMPSRKLYWMLATFDLEAAAEATAIKKKTRKLVMYIILLA